MPEKDRKDIVKRYNGSMDAPDDSYVVWDSRIPGQDQGVIDPSATNEANNIADVINQSPEGVAQDTLGIWRNLSPAYGYSNNYNQLAIEGLMNLNEGDNVYLYDIETLGTAPFHSTKNSLDFYTPTEIAFLHTKYVNGKLVSQGRHMSLFVRPNDKSLKHIEQLIRKVETGHWVGLTNDERRTLSALMVYGDERLFEKTTKFGRKIVTITGQRRDFHPLKGTVINSSKNIERMKKGLEMLKQGTSPEDAVYVLGRFLNSKGQMKLGGFNVLGFDKPLFMDYINNQIGKDVKNSDVKKAIDKLNHALSLNHVDALHALRALKSDPYSRFGASLSLESLANRLAINKGTSHFALSDVKTTKDVINRLLKDQSVAEMITKGGNGIVSWDQTPIQAGDVLFGRLGMSSSLKGPYDAVLRLRDGQFVPAYNDIRPNPIYKNATYQVQRFFNGIEIQGKKMFGVHLYNESDDLHHFIFRENLGDLQNVIQKHLEYVGGKSSALAKAHQFQNEDRALRRWRKLFNMDENPANLARRFLTALDITRQAEKEGLSLQETRSRILKADKYMSDEFVRDFFNLRGLVETQEPYLREFLNRIDNSSLRDDIPAQNRAFAEFGRLIREKFGVTEMKRELPEGMQALHLEVGGFKNQILLSNVESVRSGFYGALYRGHTSRPIPSVLRQRFKELIGQLQALDPSRAKQYKQKYQDLMSEFNQLRPDESIDTILTELANHVLEAHKRNASMGLSYISVEAPTQIVHADSKVLDSIMQQSIQSAMLYKLPQNTPVRFAGEAHQLIQEHQQAIQRMLKESGLDQTRVGKDRILKPYNSLEKLVKTFNNQGFHTQFRYDPTKQSLLFVLSHDSNVLNQSLKDLVQNNQAAVVQIPLANKEGYLRYKNQSRVLRPKLTFDKGRPVLVTSFDEVVDRLTRNAYRAKEILDHHDRLGTKEAMIEIESMLRGSVSDTLKSLSMNNRFLNPNDAEDMFKIGSRRANWVRAGYLDAADLAETWYIENYNLMNPEQRKALQMIDPTEIKKQLKPGESFMDAMPMKVKAMFQQDLPALLERFGIKADYHSVKNTHAINALLSTRDVRELIPFGFFSPMGRENIQKSVNYIALNEERVKSALKTAGMTASDVERMLRPGITTMKDLQFQDELSHLQMRVAYMSDGQIAERLMQLRDQSAREKLIKDLEEKRKRGHISDREYKQTVEFIKQGGLDEYIQKAEMVSTYDGMSIVSDDLRAALDITRERRIKLSHGATLDDQIIQRIQSHIGDHFDLSRDYVFEQGISVRDLFKDDKLTVGKLVKNGYAIDKFKNWNHHVFIKGWDAAERTLILEEFVPAMNSTKILSNVGDRLTATFLPQPLLNILAGESVHAIFPTMDIKKGQWGSWVYATTNFYIDELRRQLSSKQGKLTVQNITLEQGLETIRNYMIKYLGLSDKEVLVQNGQIVLDSRLGATGGTITAEQVYHFQKAVDEFLGTDYHKRDIMYGVIGVGEHDVWNWENSSVDGEGLVKYGPKELSMLETKTERVRERGIKVRGLIHNWYSQYIEESNKTTKRVLKGIVRVASLDRDYQPGKDDVVIRTTGEIFSLDDPHGIRTGRISEKGVREISMHALHDVPRATAKDMVFLAEDYAKTIVDFGRIEGKFADGMTFRQAIEARKGIAFLELPDDKFSRKYLPIVDLGDITKRSQSEIATLKELEKIQVNLWRKIKEFQALGTDGEQNLDKAEAIRKRIEELMSKHEEKIAHITASARDESVRQQLFSARLDKGGRFRIQSVNPYANYKKIDGKWKQTGFYKESHIYISRDRAKELIDGLEKNIAKVWGVDTKKFTDQELTEFILDNMNRKGLYGLANRYPTISEPTLQPVRVMIDPHIQSDERLARLTIGTLARSKGDNDGDFYSILLTHYKANADKAKAMHIELAQMTRYEARLNAARGAEIMNELEKAAQKENITIGELMTNDAFSHIRQVVFDAKNSSLYAAESMAARLQHQYIGPIDNLRDKYFELTKTFYGTLKEHGVDFENHLAAVEELGRAFSQDSISAKKISGVNLALEFLSQGYTREEAIHKAEEEIVARLNLIPDMNKWLSRPDAENIEKLEGALNRLGIIKDSNRDQIKQGLQAIHELYVASGPLGGVTHPSMSLTYSEGPGAEKVRQVLQGEHGVIPTRNMQNMIQLLDENRAKLEEAAEAAKKTFVYNYQKLKQSRPVEIIEEIMNKVPTEEVSTALSDAVVREESRVGLGNLIRKIKPHGGKGGFGLGLATGILGMWAASAMLRDGPTPEAMQERESVFSNLVAKPKIPKPTARVSPSGEHISISISAKTAQGLSEQDIASLVHEQLQTMTNMNISMNLNINDNTQELKQDWMKEAVANALKAGYAY